MPTQSTPLDTPPNNNNRCLCGSEMVGDGINVVFHCSNSTGWESLPPDSTPYYCVDDGDDGDDEVPWKYESLGDVPY